MPTIPQQHIPCTKDPKEFEKICRDVLCRRFYTDEYAFELYGRNGQDQHGLDIICKKGAVQGEKIIAAQCKNYFDKKNIRTLKKILLDDLNSICEWEHSAEVSRVVIMTALEKDAPLQDFILSQQEDYPFAIEMMFWEDISEVLLKNRDLMETYYPGYCAGRKAEEPEESITDRWHKRMFLEPEDSEKTCKAMYICPTIKWNKADGTESIFGRREETEYVPGTDLREDPMLIFQHEEGKEEKLMIVLGAPGSGKSMLLHWLFHDGLCGKKVLFYRFRDFQIPDWNVKPEELRRKMLTHMGISSIDQLKDYYLLLDGYDEIHADKKKRVDFLESLKKEWILKNPKCNLHIIVTCRLNYMNLDENGRDSQKLRCRSVTLCPLSLVQCQEFMAKYGYDCDLSFMEEDEGLQDILGVPLIFYMMMALKKLAPGLNKNDIYSRLFAIEGGIYEQSVNNWNSYEKTKHNSVYKPFEEKEIRLIIDRLSQEIGYWMYVHENNTDTDDMIPRNVAEDLLDKIQKEREASGEVRINDINDLLMGSFYHVRHTERSSREIRFVHKSMMEFFAAEKIAYQLYQISRAEDREKEWKKLGHLLSEKPLSLEILGYLKEILESGDEANYLVAGLQDIRFAEEGFSVMLKQGMAGAEAGTGDYLALETRMQALFFNVLSVIQTIRALCGKILFGENNEEIRKIISLYCKRYAYKEMDLSYVNLSSMDLSHCNFPSVNLTGAVLKETDFTSADLSFAKMNATKLDRTVFERTLLYGIDPCVLQKIQNADNYTWADMTGTRIQNHQGMPVIGGLYEFGSYPQGADGEVKKILWRVLDVDAQEGKALLLSDQILDCVPYNDEDEDTNWAKCTIRKWLNGADGMTEENENRFFGKWMNGLEKMMTKKDSFLYRAFNEKERARILITDVQPDEIPHSEYRNTEQGKAVKNKIFLLSGKEVVKYFAGRNIKEEVFWIRMGGFQAAATGTEYAKRQNRLWVNEQLGISNWWLRSVGSSPRRALSVNSVGDVDCDGNDVFNGRVGVRPALWISLKS